MMWSLVFPCLTQAINRMELGEQHWLLEFQVCGHGQEHKLLLCCLYTDYVNGFCAYITWHMVTTTDEGGSGGGKE